MFPARFAELFQFQAIFQDLFVLARSVVQGLTDRAFKFDEIVLGHTMKCWPHCTGLEKNCQHLANIVGISRYAKTRHLTGFCGATVGG